ncbi:MAG: hypothetical protein AAGD09_03265 [Cyanobacteria bacterium P01_F01_bin.56]
MTLITVDNVLSLTHLSTQGRSGTPDGNIFWDPANNGFQIITVEELSTYDPGGGAIANQLTNFDGITLQAIYRRMLEDRENVAALQNYDRFASSVFQFAGAWRLVNGIKPDSTGIVGLTDERQKIRGSGWQELAANGNLDRVYFGPFSLNGINAASRPYVLIAQKPVTETTRLAATPIDASRDGDYSEAVQVFGSTANGDTGAGNFDFRDTHETILSVRDHGFTTSESTSTASGAGTLENFALGFGVGNVASPTATITEGDLNTVTPYTQILYTRNASAVTRTGFNEADGDFTDEVSNTGGATLNQIRARLDYLFRQDTDIDQNTNGLLGKRMEPPYTVVDGILVFRSGLFVPVNVADQQLIRLKDNSGNEKTYPFLVQVDVTVSEAWALDSNAWFRCIFADGDGSQDFNTATAVTVNDSSAAAVAGTSADSRVINLGSGNYVARFVFDYDANNQAGLNAGEDKAVIFLAEGNGGAAQGKASFTITRTAVVIADASAPAEDSI